MIFSRKNHTVELIIFYGKVQTLSLFLRWLKSSFRKLRTFWEFLTFFVVVGKCLWELLGHNSYFPIFFLLFFIESIIFSTQKKIIFDLPISLLILKNIIFRVENPLKSCKKKWWKISKIRRVVQKLKVCENFQICCWFTFFTFIFLLSGHKNPLKWLLFSKIRSVAEKVKNLWPEKISKILRHFSQLPDFFFFLPNQRIYSQLPDFFLDFSIFSTT